MQNRIKQLRLNSLEAENTISDERALLVTEYYKSIGGRDIPVPIQRAEAFKYIFENKELCVNEGELIIGERGPKPKATPTYPEI